MGVISESTKVRVSLIIVMFSALSTSLIWVGTIQADVSKLKEDRIDLSKKVEKISEDTAFIRGKIETLKPR